MIAALIAAIGNAVESIFDKVIVGEKNMTGLVLFKLSMLFTAIWTAIPTFIWGSFQPNFFTPKYLLLFSGLLFAGLSQNILYYLALEKKDICEVEPIILLSTPMTIILAMAIFPSERSLTLIIASFVATAALLFSRLEKKHLDFDKYSWFLLGSGVFCAIEAILIRYMLAVTNAVSLYGIRTASLALLLYLLFRGIKTNKTNTKGAIQVFLNSGITSIYFVARFFAIASIGIVKSSLILLLGPVIILLFSKIFLKERIPLKRAFGDAVVLACVAVISLVG
jgi:drug/metabolite transporter (DMT)-like permease